MADLPKEYKACCYSNPGKNSIGIRHDMPMPEPGANEVLIHLCAPDISRYKDGRRVTGCLEHIPESAIRTTLS